ncbi:protein DMP10-like [Neltuma alba]|uniref:protein DMP10-like n=1 Tax=Neltuma alba TaxID=207710 RepID=UPI0010A52102|nr:protein DMP10-like [Prosopis alba]
MSQSSLIQDPDSNHPVHKTLASAANLANLLPTSTVLAFNALIPSFSNNGVCRLSNHILTLSAILVCALLCFFSSFTDSFVARDGRLYYGIATFKGLYIFNHSQFEEVTESDKYKISSIDFVHAFLSLVVFLIFAITNTNVQSCLMPHVGPNESAFITNLPLAAGVLSTFLFTIFPTTRRGMGSSDMHVAD